MNLTETQKAYLAGIVDGEGYVTVHARKVGYGKSCQPKVMIASTSVKWLSDLRDITGGLGSFHLNQKRKSVKWKPFGQWCIVGKAAQNFLKEIYPYLQIKKEQAWLVINFEMVGQGKRRNKEQLEKQVQDLNSLRILNQRGTGISEEITVQEMVH